MLTNMKPVYFALIGFACFALAIQEGRTDDTKKRPYPHSCAGIEIDVATDADVQKLYGKGYFVADESHLGGRYYVDPGHRVTLHVGIGTDRLIDGMEVQEGVHFPHKPTEQILKAAEMPRLTGNPKIDGELPLGTTLHDVRARYGKPVKDEQEGNLRTLAYTVTARKSGHWLDYEVNFVFARGRLVRVLFDVGD